MLSLLYGPTLTYLHDYWKNHHFDYVDFCQPSDVWLFNMLSRCFSKEQVSFNLVAAVTLHSDFGAQENKICHCFHFFPIYLPLMMGLDATILVFWMLRFKPAYKRRWPSQRKKSDTQRDTRSVCADHHAKRHQEGCHLLAKEGSLRGNQACCFQFTHGLPGSRTVRN